MGRDSLGWVSRFAGDPVSPSPFGEKSRLAALLEHFSRIDDPREPWRVAHPLTEVLLLVVCGMIADCDDYDHITAWGEAHPGSCARCCRVTTAPRAVAG